MNGSDLYDPAPARGWLPWGALAPILGLAFIIATQLAAYPLIEPLDGIDAAGSPTSTQGLLVLTLVPFGLLWLVVLGWVRFVERRPFTSIGLIGNRKARTFTTGVGIGVGSISLVVALIALAGGIHATGAPRAWATPSTLPGIALLLIGFAVQASVEELLFRGWLLSVLARKFNVLAAVIASSLLFALVHFTRGEPWLVNVNDFVFGLFACTWALRTRNILGVMGWHTGWNWLLAVGFGLPLTGLDVGIPALLVDLEPTGPGWLTGGAEGPEGSIVTFVCFAVAAAGSVLIGRKRRRAILDQPGKSSIAS